jgi:[FeFe] hydrogenase H-cluster maturation GTPase HydF
MNEGINITDVNVFDKYLVNDLINVLQKIIPKSAYCFDSILGDLVKKDDIILLITPIDIEAPEGRLILPQIQTIRDVLDNDCICMVAKESEIDTAINKKGIKPKLAVTDSQAFNQVNATIPDSIQLTSFSILYARFKGDFRAYIKGTKTIDDLKDGDNILIMESCSHHIVTDDIGREKIPNWLNQYTGKKLNYEVLAGLDQPKNNIKEYALVVQCGGCMLTRKQVLNRIKSAIDNNVPVTNYGMLIAFVHGIFERALKPFGIDNV